MSSRIVQPTAPELTNPKAYSDGVKFLKALQAMHKAPSQFLFVDKISFNVAHRSSRQIAPRGTGTVHRPLRSRGPSIHVFSGLVGDGAMSPFYATIPRKRPLPFVIDDQENKVELLPDKKRRGERAVTAFIEEMTRRGTLEADDVLVTDNDRSWLTDDVNTLLDQNSIIHLTYPKYLGARLDPCDNSFHSMFRRRIDKRILLEADVDLARRIQILSEEYHATPTEAVLGCIRRCGLFDCHPEHVMAEILCEGRRKKLIPAAAERKCVAAYKRYQRGKRWAEPDEAEAVARAKKLPLIYSAYTWLDSTKGK